MGSQISTVVSEGSRLCGFLWVHKCLLLRCGDALNVCVVSPFPPFVLRCGCKYMSLDSRFVVTIQYIVDHELYNAYPF